MYRTKDQVALEFIAEGRRRNITPRGQVICIATGLVESELTVYANSKVPESLSLPHDAVGSDGLSVGPLQQQIRKGTGGQWWWGDAKTCMDPTTSSGLFYDRLAKTTYVFAGSDAAAGAIAQQIQQSAYPDRYAARMPDAQRIYNRLTQEATVDDDRPDFNEFPIWSTNASSRSGMTPRLFLLHTQEGGGGDSAAEDLAKWYQNANQGSYHYAVSQASDGGVTVVDCVDTDDASWSVGNANNASINLCFAGSRASWTRDQWLANGRAINVAAYLAVQDARKYGFAPTVIAPPYTGSTAMAQGITDHQWVTQVFRWGTHTDVGPGFPWDYFAACVTQWAGTSAPPATPAVKRFPDDWTDRELMIEVLRQLRGPTLTGWPQLGGRTLVDSVAELRDRS